MPDAFARPEQPAFPISFAIIGHTALPSLVPRRASVSTRRTRLEGKQESKEHRVHLNFWWTREH
ncbi:hypothetical protein, partial [Ralstonia pseudosolanacearum]|uniref:hypothetical protein n=1 Tax=Ralstonia pseudosolanacearum TaxID=1310165 RepID=UPI001FF86562